MNELPDTIARIWGFLLGPLLTVLILGGLSVLIAPRREAQLRKWIFTWALVTSEIDIAELWERLGFSKALPVLSFFLLSFVLYALHRGVHATGEVVPGRVVYFGEATLARADHDEMLDKFWARYPTLARPSQVASLALDRVSELVQKDSIAVGSGSRQWQNESGQASTRLSYVKGLMIATLALALAELTLPGRRMRTLIRLAFAQLVLIAAAVHFTFSQVYAIEQQAFANLRALSYSLSEEDSAALLDSSRVNQMSEFRTEARKEWWRFEFVSNGYPAWLYRQILHD